MICFDEFAPLFTGHIVHRLGASGDKLAQSQHVFDALRTFDATDVPAIWAQCPDSAGLGLAVGNRLKKAAGFHTEEADGAFVLGITGGAPARARRRCCTHWKGAARWCSTATRCITKCSGMTRRCAPT